MKRLSNFKLFGTRWSLVALPLLVLGASYEGFSSPEPTLPRAPRVPAPHDPSCEAHGERAMPAPRSGKLLVQFGDDIPGVAQVRIREHLEAASARRIDVIPADGAWSDDVAVDTLVIGFGDTTARERLITSAELAELGDEGYLLRSGRIGAASAIVVDGDGLARAGAADVGALYGSYALLETLGFGFLHPLEPTLPTALPAVLPQIDRASSPRWPVRGLQLHTMHPLELTDLLEGWGPGGPADHAGWEAMLTEWDAFLEWMLANGQNRVHWVWLAADSWGEFAASDERMERIERVVDRAHELGIEVGLDVPLRLQQQNAARLVRAPGSLEDEVRQIEEGVAHVMKAGFDYLVTEAGTTEFTAPDDRRMLAWMNAMTATAADEHGVPTFIKVHASTGQLSEHFDDPETGAPLNFNFLPHYADERLGVLPHTVQHYALDDPAPTYGNDGFGHIREFLQEQAGRRPTVWHPETAYWVSFDNDVPLFLPVYASRRVHDLRLLAGDEEAGRMGRGEHAGSMMDGQLTFSSGWEWGYWLQEVVTARAAWDPHLDAESDEAALRALLAPVSRVFGDAGGPLLDWLIEYTRAQQALLIEGRVDGVTPDDVVRRNGQAYLQGSETWDDASDLLATELGLTHGRMQPEKLSFGDMRDSSFDRAEYDEAIAPLLRAMDERFAQLSARLEMLRDDVPPNALGLYEELADAAEVTALRARQVRGLYGYVAEGGGSEAAEAHLKTAQDALDRALGVTAHREAHYRVPAERIAGWRKNPTVYEFTYLWTVRSLYYWQRDEALAVDAAASLCRHNIIDPVDVGLGDGRVSDAMDRFAHGFSLFPPFASVAECMRAPASAPTSLPAAWTAHSSD